jgi:Protein of unknown function (DUF4058)
MKPPFPGMDPWLESPTSWPDVHNSLITSIRDVLAPQLRPRYFVGVESRTTLLTGLDVDLLYKPDVSIHALESRASIPSSGVAGLERPEVRTYNVSVPITEETEETFLTILELPGRKLVTVIEVLSPTNKKTKDARAEYLKKRDDLVRTSVNFVEIDLLRAGEPMPLRSSPPSSDYRILVCRARRSRDAKLYAFPYTSAIPAIPIPLLPGDPEPELDLNGILHALFDRARYDLVIDYAQPPDPPLRPGDEAWAASIVARTAAAGREPSPIAGAAP